MAGATKLRAAKPPVSDPHHLHRSCGPTSCTPRGVRYVLRLVSGAQNLDLALSAKLRERVAWSCGINARISKALLGLVGVISRLGPCDSLPPDNEEERDLSFWLSFGFAPNPSEHHRELCTHKLCSHEGRNCMHVCSTWPDTMLHKHMESQIY